MGLIRFLLAVSVAIDHFGSVLGIRMGPGAIEVEAFFIISGFYMALVLEDRYAGQLKLFYTNRYLRLFPSYFCILVLTLGFSLITGAHSRFTLPMAELGEIFLSGDFWTKAYIVVANLGIVLLDTALFLSFDGENLRFTTDFRDSVIPVYQFLLIPQGWSLGLEIYFYALAPFLLKRTWTLVAACAVSVLLFIALSLTALPGDPWTHRFFPSILFLFLAGSLAWKVFRAHLEKLWMRRLGGVLLVANCMAILLLASTPFDPDVTRFGLLMLVAVSVGPVFALTKDIKFDRRLGDLSYPIYVSHLLAIVIAGTVTAEYAPLLGFVLTLVLSAVLVFVVERPLDRYRHRRVVRKATSDT